jgi:hypothetical protein
MLGNDNCEQKTLGLGKKNCNNTNNNNNNNNNNWMKLIILRIW